MIIRDSQITFKSRNEQSQTFQEEKSLSVDMGLNAAGRMPSDGVNANQTGGVPQDSRRSIEIMVAEILLEQVLGRKVKLNIGSAEISESQPIRNPSIPQSGFEFNHNVRYTESESLSFAAEGIVNTADGKRIEISAVLNISREFAVENNLNISSGSKKIDPLVLNYDGPAASLSSEKFEFDLTSDGNKELISFLSPGSGFLALDINDNGIIDNGSELFGPSTGNGFHELARYDQDGNRWIDEADSIYKDLKLLTINPVGEQKILSLKEAGVEAIYLENLEASFNYKDNMNNLLGSSRSSGIFLNGRYQARTIQQIDFAV